MASLNKFSVVDYLAEGIDRSTYQFMNKPVFTHYLDLLTNEKWNLEHVFKDLQQNRGLDTATGVNLDIIGNIVGIDRQSISITGFTFFGFSGVPQCGSFGDLNLPTVGSDFWNYGSPTSGNAPFTDSDYRFFIRAKIMANITAVTPEDFMNYFKFVLEAPFVQISEYPSGAYVIISIGRKLSDYEKALLNYKPANGRSGLVVKPVGVRVKFQDVPVNFFGFEDTPGALGFGDFYDPSVGGYLADIFSGG